MKPIARLWNAGIVGKLVVGFVTLLLSCCVLGAIGTLVSPRSTRGPAMQVTEPLAAQPTAVPATIAPATAASAVEATDAPPTAQPSTAVPTPTAIPRPAAPTAPAPAPTTPAESADRPAAAVVKVIDGDTVDVRVGDQVVRVRLIGIDTPETVDPRTPVQCFGREASAKAHELLDGQTVTLAADPSQDDRDRYDRLLRYVWLADGRLFNQEMVAQGYAFEYTYDRPYKYRDAFKQAERDAREAQRGLWSPETCAGEHRAVEATPPRVRPTSASAPSTRRPAPAKCNPAYPDVCIPPPPPDLDCGDIPYRRFRVLPPDPHRFDGDHDGIGCER